MLPLDGPCAVPEPAPSAPLADGPLTNPTTEAADVHDALAAGDPEVEVRISTRRRKSASAFWSDGRVVVVLPAAMPGSARAEMVDDLVRRVLNYRPHIAASDTDLAARAIQLSAAIPAAPRRGSKSPATRTPSAPTTRNVPTSRRPKSRRSRSPG